MTGLKSFKSFENILAWEDCRDACQRYYSKCYYWTYDRKNQLCELREGNKLAGIRFFRDDNFFWGHVPEHAPDEDSTPPGEEWFEKWRDSLKEYSNKLRYGYLSAVEPKTTKPAEEWRTCEIS